jgi:hypothetical protein
MRIKRDKREREREREAIPRKVLTFYIKGESSFSPCFFVI